MASESYLKGSSGKQSKSRGGGKTGKCDPLMNELPGNVESLASKKITGAIMPEKKSHNHLQKGAVSSLTDKIDSSLHLGNAKQARTLEQTADQETKTIDLGNVKHGSTSAKVSDGASSLAKTSESAKISDRVDFVESGKSSLCRGSTSTDVSDESSCSSFSSAVNKPHKANDLRWEAIQAVRSKDGALDLRHFRLLKKLGCGDIGSVYLSELCGTKCYFAMKVMDKASLASRKKLLRAQTEREILQSRSSFPPDFVHSFRYRQVFMFSNGVLSWGRPAWPSAKAARKAFLRASCEVCHVLTQALLMALLFIFKMHVCVFLNL